MITRSSLRMARAALPPSQQPLRSSARQAGARHPAAARAGPGRHRHITPHAAGSNEGSIDDLADALAREAARRRLAQDGASMDAPPASDAPAPASSLPAEGGSLAGLSVDPALEALLVQELGPGGFVAADLELLQELGRLSVQQVATAGSAGQQPRAAVIAWAALYRSGMPYQTAVQVLLKEYLPHARHVAWNELAVMHAAAGPLPPGDKWQAASKQAEDGPPIVPLLGYFLSPPSDAAYALTGSNEDSLWLVYQQGLRPASLLLRMPPPAPPGGGLLTLLRGKAEAEQAAWAQRRRFLRAWARGVLRALAHLHVQGVAHGSLSPGSVLVSSAADADADSLVVVVSNLGFGQLVAGSGPEAALGSLAQRLAPAGTPQADPATALRRDLQAAALLLGEVFTAALAGRGGAAGGYLDAATLQRLLFDVFHEDVAQFKGYCLEDEGLAEFVAFLDEAGGAGWELLAALMAGDTPAADLVQGRFCELAPAQQ